MIVKQKEPAAETKDRRRQAGHHAEDQMAFYLHRAFASDESLFVLNDLRIVDEANLEHDGSPRTCQIDHLVIHRWGMFIIESKSVSTHVKVRDDGSGGDQWTRVFGRREEGMQSPIQQARLQAEALRAFLQRHREQLLGKMPFGLRTLHKLRNGTDQRGFKNLPIQVIIAISDGGDIKRIGKWREPEGPFGTFVCKADLAADKVRMEYDKHRSGASILTKDLGEYGLWSMEPDEAPRTARFLAEHHTPIRSSPAPRSKESTSKPAPPPPPPPPAPAPAPTAAPVPPAPVPPAPVPPAPVPPAPPAHQSSRTPLPACKSCGAHDLAAQSGRYGYYWRCLACRTNTAMPKQCSACGASGHDGQNNRIRKEGPGYFRNCAACGIEERIWLEKPQT